MSYLKRDIAPIDKLAWDAIDQRARELFIANLHFRKVTDIVGPLGWDTASYSTGDIEIIEPKGDKIRWGIRKSLPLIEIREPFVLNRWELDNIQRGKKNIDLVPLEKAVLKVCEFENNVLLNGLEKAGISGLMKYASKNSVDADVKDEAKFLNSLYMAISIFNKNGIEGPYNIFIDEKIWSELVAMSKGYPFENRVNKLIDGKVITVNGLGNALITSSRGGDFELVLGADLSIGYESHTEKEVTLFISESFTFNIITPEAVILIKPV